MASPLRVFHDSRQMYAWTADGRRSASSIGLVPTMGALHAGHFSLVERSRAECDLTVATIFLNPTQFSEQEDLAHYPRPLNDDLEGLAERGVDAVFVPDHTEVYPPGFSTFVEPPSVAGSLEGRHRAGHFRGVSTVVLKLFHIIPADTAYFGQKDFQQVRVIEHMVIDLNVPIRIEMCATVRDADGLALSSRNVHLDRKQRQRALSLHAALEEAADMVARGECDAEAIKESIVARLQRGGVDRVDYVAVADPHTLNPVRTIDGTVVALIAAHVGGIRLIDNALITSVRDTS